VAGRSAVKMGRKSSYNNINKTKLCKKCSLQKPVTEFYSDSRNLYDKYRHVCKKCFREYSKKWNLNNKDKLKIIRHKCYVKHKKEYNKRKVISNKLYRSKNREHVRKYFREYQKKRLNTNIKFRIKHAAARLIRSYLYRRGHKKNKNSSPMFYTLGYSLEELMKHLENLFVDGMCWENYGRCGWTIDHIRPDSKFLYTSIHDKEFKESWNLKNLQPMWFLDNCKKGNRA
jgi:hypothetical protein